MKKIRIAFLISFVIISLQMQGQDGKLNLSIYGGLCTPGFKYVSKNAATQNSTNGTYTGTLFGLSFATLGDNGASGIGAVEYQTTGFDISNTGIAGVDKIKTKINYVVLNAGGGMKIWKQAANLIQFQIGATVGYAVNGKSTTSYTNGSDSTKTLKFGDKKPNDFQPYNFSLKTGFSYNVSHLNVAAYYVRGLSDLSITDNVSIKNRGFNLSLGYTFNITPKH